MIKCSSCDNKFIETLMTPVLVRGIECCTSDPDEDDITDKYVCNSCSNEENSDSLTFGFCKLDFEKSYALHISDLPSHESGFYCREHISETSMNEEDSEDMASYIEYINKE